MTRFRRETDGSGTIEFVIWLPFIMLVFMFVADVAYIFNGRALATKVMQEANRKMSVGSLVGTTATQNYIIARVRPFAPNATAKVIPKQGVVKTWISIPTSDLDVMGVMSLMKAGQMVITSEQYVEKF